MQHAKKFLIIIILFDIINSNGAVSPLACSAFIVLDFVDLIFYGAKL